MRLDELHVYLLAAGLSFNVLLCLLPLFLVALYIAGSIIHLEPVIESVRHTLSQALPLTPGTESFIDAVVDEIRSVKDSSTTAGLVGIAVLLWTSSALFSSLRTAFNAIFSIPTPRFFLWYKLKDLLFTFLVVLLILVSTVLTPLTSVLASSLSEHVSWLASWHIGSLLSFSLSALIAFLYFGVLLRFVPNKPQPLFIIMSASISSMILWESARFAFTYYLNHIASFGRFYGTFSVLVASALWIYYSALIVLVSAEVAEYAYEQRRARLKAKQIKSSPATKTRGVR